MHKNNLTKLIKQRIRALESAKQNYDSNPAFLKNVKTANIESIQNELSTVKKLLYALDDEDN